MTNINPLSIESIAVTDLFGSYDYSISTSREDPDGRKVLILYGDNGGGKTTILKIAFHLIASETTSGHKGTVARIPFRSFVIVFSDGTRIEAERLGKDIVGSFTMSLHIKGRKKIVIEWEAEAPNYKVKAKSDKQDRQQDDFLAEAQRLGLALYFLTDNRQLHVSGANSGLTIPWDHSPSSFLLLSDRELLEEDIFNRRNTTDKIDPEAIAKYLLRKSMKIAHNSIQLQAMSGTSKGDSSVNALYGEVLKRLTGSGTAAFQEPTSAKADMVVRLKRIESSCSEYAKYDLMPKFVAEQFLSTVALAEPHQMSVFSHVLKPYLESLEKKLEALSQLYGKVDAFVNLINRFYTNKQLRFTLQQGFTIHTTAGKELDPSFLSSGERHLMLLFCNSLAALDRPSIMMIDEPEISLNVKWQRILVQSLLELVAESPIQYIFCTHSIELLAKHRNLTSKLVNLRGH